MTTSLMRPTIPVTIDGRPLYAGDFGGTQDNPSMYGLDLAFSTNLKGSGTAGLSGGAGSPGKVLAIVGDFSHSIAVIRKDLSTAVFREGSIGAHNLMAQNKVAVRWEMRMGYQIHDRDRMFVA